jgi:hypothetical protein
LGISQCKLFRGVGCSALLCHPSAQAFGYANDFALVFAQELRQGFNEGAFSRAFSAQDVDAIDTRAV